MLLSSVMFIPLREWGFFLEYMRIYSIVFLLFACSLHAHTQPEDAALIESMSNDSCSQSENLAPPLELWSENCTDTLLPPTPPSLNELALRTDSTATQTTQTALPPLTKTLPNKNFVPDPQRALWLSLVLPGAGQIYNRKYWKLPIVYGGFLGCTYAFLWNQQTYLDYSQAYLDLMDSNPETKSYLNFFPQGYDITGRESQFQQIFKNRKDRYRRYRDLSVICFVGVYLLSVVDAYVDAQLSVFDITPDLSLHIAPTSFSTPQSLGIGKSTALGLGATLQF